MTCNLVIVISFWNIERLQLLIYGLFILGKRDSVLLALAYVFIVGCEKFFKFILF